MSATNSEIVCGIVFTFVVTYFIVKLSKRTLHHSLHAPDVTKGHCWSYTEMFSQPSYCNICETLIITSDGAFCDSCGVCGDSSDCINQADKDIPCKVITSTETTHKHHWVKGNLPLNAHCEVCEEECGIGSGLVDFYCCWCARCVHAACIMHVAEVGREKDNKGLIIPDSLLLNTPRSHKNSEAMCTLFVAITSSQGWFTIELVQNRDSESHEASSIYERQWSSKSKKVMEKAERDEVVEKDRIIKVLAFSCKVFDPLGELKKEWL
ncbi:unnamed protein product, partial [Meganyctiphanes norvegica]